METFVWLAILFWILKRIFGYRTQGPWGIFPQTPLNKALAAFILINAFSIFLSVNPGSSFEAFLGKVTKFILIYFMMVETINSEKRLYIFLIIVLLSVSLIVADAGVQYFIGIDFLRGYSFQNLRACFSTRNDFGAWLIMLIPILAGGLMANQIRIFSGKMKIFLGVLVILMSICLLITFSRGAWLGLLLSLFLLMLYILKSSQGKTRRGLVAAFISLIIIFSCGVHYFKMTFQPVWIFDYKSGQPVGDRIKSIVHIKEGSIFARTQLWQEALEIIKDYPLLGTGLNTYTVVIPRYKIFEEGAMYPHNSFLQMAAETGLLGLLAFLWVLFEYFRNGFKYIYKRKNFLVLGTMTGVLAFLFQSFVDTNLYELKLVVLFWFILGLTVAVMNIEEKSKCA